MMNQEIKRRIDNARQVLVGKVPDPKSQVEQITTALIYKFMDDMDTESVRLGGNPGFFVNDYEKYSWKKLMDSRLGGQNRLNLYAEAVMNLSQNPHLPQLFRDIFKDAFLPYRDPETLNLFLKEIDGFSYGSTDNLGDAYEYLLSVLGSQGNAGQFLTPRHIIKFIVSIVDPKKNETMLDPACGTAGFLILAYLHILEANTEKKPGDLLTPDEKDKLIHNFVGYDIDPGMRRLSLVNMYLHNFSSPHIYEYDTLTNDEKWQDQFDVIMANPPFMSPKGGIRPHKRFAIHANRSEVLFVDYIAEHLNINGRAGVIVPEGIIFQSANAYKSLRKMLIDDYLWAVVSLPAGVFHPYSGVKTSILFMDKRLTKQTDKILFVKIKNDGFDLGAQRREIDKNDLPFATEVMNFYKNNIRENKNLELPEGYSKIAHLVAKDKIAESGDYNLSGDRYKEVINLANQKWPMVELGEVCEIYQPKTITSKEIKQTGKYKVFGANGVIGFYDKYNHEDAEVLVTCRGATCGTVNLSEPKSWITGNAMVVKPKDNLDKKFLFYFLKNTNLKSVISGSAQPQITRASLSPFKIPLPPLEVQKEIVEQIEVKQKAIKAAKAVIENLERERRYFGQSLRKLEGVEWVDLGEVCTFKYGKPLKEVDRKGGEYPVYGSNGIVGYHDDYLVEGPFIIVGRKGTAGAVVYSEKSGFPIDTTFYVQLKDQKVDLKFLYLIMQTLNLGKINTQAGVPGLNRNDAYKTKILLPSLEIQKQLVAEMEEQEKIIEANKKLVGIMEQKIAEVLREI